jgi:hypothetical protein
MVTCEGAQNFKFNSPLRRETRRREASRTVQRAAPRARRRVENSPELPAEPAFIAVPRRADASLARFMTPGVREGRGSEVRCRRQRFRGRDGRLEGLSPRPSFALLRGSDAVKLGVASALNRRLGVLNQQVQAAGARLAEETGHGRILAPAGGVGRAHECNAFTRPAADRRSGEAGKRVAPSPTH